MTPAARIQAAIDVLAALETTAQPADRFLRDFFRARRYAGSKDRAAVAERVFSVFRHRASLAWRMRSEEPRALVIASLLRDGESCDAVAELFGGGAYGPHALSDAERMAIADAPAAHSPLAVQGDFPAFLEADLTEVFGARLLDEMAALNARAAIDLRANTLKITRDGLLERLREEGFAAEAAPYAPHGVRLAPGAKSGGLQQTALFLSGAFEFQDEAAQIATALCGAKPDEHILDLAAGAGGKTLALAAEMQNRGRIVAYDVRGEALEQLRSRAARAGVSIVTIADSASEPPREPFDAVFVDAPCSGSGTWRRQPELKWRLTPERLAALNRQQDALLEAGAGRVGTGGRLLYATCSILPCENEALIARFLSRHPDFAVVPAAKAWTGTQGLAFALGTYFHASPLTTHTDGFFVAVLQREVGSRPPKG
jgi:16S rRNA (cytosine967-C5)-methyltransferase